jgi:hypothetical protein
MDHGSNQRCPEDGARPLKPKKPKTDLAAPEALAYIENMLRRSQVASHPKQDEALAVLRATILRADKVRS